MPDEVNLAILGTKVDALTKQVEQLVTDNREQARSYVTQQVWAQRNISVDDAMRSQGREIGELRTEMRSRRVSWPAVGALAIAAAALLLQLINALGRGGA